LNTSVKLNDQGCFLDTIHYKTDYLRKALQYPKTDLGIFEIYDSLKQAKTIEKSKLNELLEDVRSFIKKTDVTALNPYMGFLIQEIQRLIQSYADANRISKNLIILDGPLETPIQPFDYLDESVARTKHTRREFIDQKAQLYNLNNLNDHLICYTQKQKTFSQPDSEDRRFILGLLGEQPFSNNINSPKSLLTIQKELGEQIKRSMTGRFVDTDTIHQTSEDLRDLSDFAIRSRPEDKGIERLWKWAKRVIHNIFTNSKDKGIHLNAKKTSSMVSLTVSHYLEKYGFHKYSEHTTDHNEEKNENELAPNMRR
jgi:transposase